MFPSVLGLPVYLLGFSVYLTGRLGSAGCGSLLAPLHRIFSWVDSGLPIGSEMSRGAVSNSCGGFCYRGLEFWLGESGAAVAELRIVLLGFSWALFDWACALFLGF